MEVAVHEPEIVIIDASPTGLCAGYRLRELGYGGFYYNLNFWDPQEGVLYCKNQNI